MPYQSITGLWRSEKGSLSFKMSQDIKDKIAQVPNGTFVNVKEWSEKKNDRAPDATLSYKVETDSQGIPF